MTFFAPDGMDAYVFEDKVDVKSRDQGVEEDKEGLLDTSLCLGQRNGGFGTQSSKIHCTNLGLGWSKTEEEICSGSVGDGKVSVAPQPA